MAAKELVEYVAKSLVDDPDAVKVEVVEEDGAGKKTGERELEESGFDIAH